MILPRINSNAIEQFREIEAIALHNGITMYRAAELVQGWRDYQVWAIAALKNVPPDCIEATYRGTITPEHRKELMRNPAAKNLNINEMSNANYDEFISGQREKEKKVTKIIRGKSAKDDSSIFEMLSQTDREELERLSRQINRERLLLQMG